MAGGEPEMAKSGLTSRDIEQALLEKHKDDVWASEIATKSHGRRRIDFWAMAKSHAKPWVTGYEIKISRSDFLNDNKWMDYLPICNRLYMVCPHGMVSPDEIMPEAGLMWATASGSKLYTKKKAPYRTEGVDPTFVYRQLLMRLSTPLHARSFDDPAMIMRIRNDANLLGEWLAKRCQDYQAKVKDQLRQRENKLLELEPYIDVVRALGIGDAGMWRRGQNIGDVTTTEFMRAYTDLMNRLDPITADPEMAVLCGEVKRLATDVERVLTKAHSLRELTSMPDVVALVRKWQTSSA